MNRRKFLPKSAFPFLPKKLEVSLKGSSSQFGKVVTFKNSVNDKPDNLSLQYNTALYFVICRVT